MKQSVRWAYTFLNLSLHLRSAYTDGIKVERGYIEFNKLCSKCNLSFIFKQAHVCSFCLLYLKAPNEKQNVTGLDKGILETSLLALLIMLLMWLSSIIV